MAIEKDRADADPLRGKETWQGLRSRPVRGKDTVFQEDGGADSADDYRLKAAISQWIVDCEIKKRAENQHRYEGNKYSEPIWQLEINAEHDHRKRPKHGEVPLSEIDRVCGPVNEHESKRDQGINTADAEAGEEKLELCP